jgi:hypothetical protein
MMPALLMRISIEPRSFLTYFNAIQAGFGVADIPFIDGMPASLEKAAASSPFL